MNDEAYSEEKLSEAFAWESPQLLDDKAKLVHDFTLYLRGKLRKTEPFASLILQSDMRIYTLRTAENTDLLVAGQTALTEELRKFAEQLSESDRGKMWESVISLDRSLNSLAISSTKAVMYLKESLLHQKNISENTSATAQNTQSTAEILGRIERILIILSERMFSQQTEQVSPMSKEERNAFRIQKLEERIKDNENTLHRLSKQHDLAYDAKEKARLKFEIENITANIRGYEEELEGASSGIKKDEPKSNISDEKKSNIIYEEAKTIINTEDLVEIFDVLDEKLPGLKGRADYEKCRRDFEDDKLGIFESGIKGRLRSIVKKHLS